jgi:hypothetical protein
MPSATQTNAPRDYRSAIDALAREHASVDTTIREIWSYDDPAQEVVRSVEVSDYELPAENGEVFTVRFGRSPDFPFPSEIALLSPEDWNRLQQGALRLPTAWGTVPARKVRG